MSVAPAVKAKPVRRPVWFRVRRLVDPATGEEVGALVPVHHSDRDAMRARGFTVGTELRAELKKRRNPKFYRLAHALARMVAEGVEGFEAQAAARDWHAVLKQLQREANVGCEEQEIEIPGIGRLIAKVARSLSFESMDEGEFRGVFNGLVQHVTRAYWPTMTPEAVEAQALLLAEREA